MQQPDARERGVRVTGEVVGVGISEDALVVDGVAGRAIGQQELPEHGEVVVGFGDFVGRCFFGVGKTVFEIEPGTIAHVWSVRVSSMAKAMGGAQFRGAVSRARDRRPATPGTA
ncbi:hypothetical protein D3C84_1076110 [compost metagenome]